MPPRIPKRRHASATAKINAKRIWLSYSKLKTKEYAESTSASKTSALTESRRSVRSWSLRASAQMSAAPAAKMAVTIHAAAS